MQHAGGFSVLGEQLLYDGKLVGDGPERPGFRQFVFEETQLGAGANGVTYRVRHRVLGVEQVVKLYFPDSGRESEKAEQEAIKNADPRVRDTAAQVHDAGTFAYPCDISYSVMESVSGIQTLREWLGQRDAEWAFFRAHADASSGTQRQKDAAKDVALRFAVAEALNVAAGYIGAVVRMNSARIVHGDLNPGNVLIFTGSAEPRWLAAQLQYPLPKKTTIHDAQFEDLHALTCRYFGTASRGPQPGTLEPAAVKFIDLGTSAAAGTSRSLGVERENRFVVDNLRKILKPLFTGGTRFERYLTPHTLGTAERERAHGLGAATMSSLPGVLPSELYRLLCVLNVFVGYSHNLRNQNSNVPNPDVELSSAEWAVINALLGPEAGTVRDSVFSVDALATLKLVLHRPFTPLVDWQAVLAHWSELHPMFGSFEFTTGGRLSHPAKRAAPASAADPAVVPLAGRPVT